MKVDLKEDGYQIIFIHNIDKKKAYVNLSFHVSR